jgi:hypothetical protein
LDPTFRRPDAVAGLTRAARAARAQESDDLCVLRPEQEPAALRYFVRCVLQVQVHDRDQNAGWGLWAEVAEPDFHRVLERWSDPAQAAEPPMSALLANRVAGYPDTLGLPATLRLTGPTTRPALHLEAGLQHPFAVEVRRGVYTHRVMEWLGGL